MGAPTTICVMTGTEKAGLAVAVVAIVAGTAVSGVFNDEVRDFLGFSRPAPVIVVDDQRPPAHSLRDEAVSTRQRDLEAIRDFRWKWESAMNVLSRTGDAAPLLRLNVEGLQLSDAENQEF